MRLRGAIIGCGYISERQLRAWEYVDGAEIVAVCDLDGEKARRRAQQFDIHGVYTDTEQLMREATLDFVDIATRPSTHLPLVTAAARHKLHSLCQKPFADTLADMEQMVAACREAAVTLMIHENTRHQAWFRKVKALIDDGVLGELMYVGIEERKRLSLPNPSFEHQPYFQEMPRLLIFEMGVHYLDTARYLLGEASRIYAHSRRVSPDIAGEDRALIMARFGEVDFLLDMSWCSVLEPSKQISWCRAKFEGTKGTVLLRRDGAMTLYTDDAEETWQFPDDTVLQSFVATQQHFIDCIKARGEAETSGPETIKTMKLAFGAYQSAGEGQVVTLDPEAEQASAKLDCGGSHGWS